MTKAELIQAIQDAKPVAKYLTRIEQHRIKAMVHELIEEDGLGPALEVLWDQQGRIGFILGWPAEPVSLGQATPGTSEAFFVEQLFQYTLVNNTARKIRKKIDKLEKRGIVADNAPLVYETDKMIAGQRVYRHQLYTTKDKPEEEKLEPCFLCSAPIANPNEILVDIAMEGVEWVYGANFATMGRTHFTIWTRVPILQDYRNEVLQWLIAHTQKLGNFTVFFNGLDAGNSIRHFHFQCMQEEFPVMLAGEAKRFERSCVNRLDWPLPAYSVNCRGGDNEQESLRDMNRVIMDWLGQHEGNTRRNTLNLIAGPGPHGGTQVVFVPRRSDRKVSTEISNGLAGCEVGGRLLIEDENEFRKVARAKKLEQIDQILDAVAPDQDEIESIERAMGKSKNRGRENR